MGYSYLVDKNLPSDCLRNNISVEIRLVQDPKRKKFLSLRLELRNWPRKTILNHLRMKIDFNWHSLAQATNGRHFSQVFGIKPKIWVNFSYRNVDILLQRSYLSLGTVNANHFFLSENGLKLFGGKFSNFGRGDENFLPLDFGPP